MTVVTDLGLVMWYERQEPPMDRAYCLVGALPDVVWVKIESPAGKVDRGLEVLDIADPPSGVLHPLDSGVHSRQVGIGEPVPEVGQDVREVGPEQRRHRGLRVLTLAPQGLLRVRNAIPLSLIGGEGNECQGAPTR